MYKKKVKKVGTKKHIRSVGATPELETQPTPVEPTPEVKVLGKPGWCSVSVWDNLNDDQKQRLINGESLESVRN